MRIFIYKDQQQLGPFTVEEALAKERSGEISKADRAWAAGQSEWVVLGDLLGAIQAKGESELNVQRERSQNQKKTRWRFAVFGLLSGVILLASILSDSQHTGNRHKPDEGNEVFRTEDPNTFTDASGKTQLTLNDVVLTPAEVKQLAPDNREFIQAQQNGKAVYYVEVTIKNAQAGNRYYSYSDFSMRDDTGISFPATPAKERFSMIIVSGEKARGGMIFTLPMASIPKALLLNTQFVDPSTSRPLVVVADLTIYPLFRGTRAHSGSK